SCGVTTTPATPAPSTSTSRGCGTSWRSTGGSTCTPSGAWATNSSPSRRGTVRNSLLGKMIGAHLTVIVIVFLTLFVAVSYLMEYYFHRAIERELVHNAAELAESLARFPDPVGPEVLAVIGTFQQFTGTTVWIVDSAGRIVTPSRDALERAGEVMAALAEETPAAVPAPGDFGLDGFISWRDWDPDTGQPLLSVAVPLRRDDAAGALYVHTPLVGVR